jgi:hypothetical protein
MSNVVCHCEEERRSNTVPLTCTVIARRDDEATPPHLHGPSLASRTPLTCNVIARRNDEAIRHPIHHPTYMSRHSLPEPHLPDPSLRGGTTKQHSPTYMYSHCEEERRSNLSLTSTNPLTWPVTPSTITEVVQLWVPARAFNPLDWLSNVAGVILRVGVKRLLRTRRTTP